MTVALVRTLAAIAASAALTISGGAVAQQSYPTKPVRLIVAAPPGGAADIVARIVAQGLSASLGQPVVVDNRPGAGGTIGNEIGAKAPPDGYALLWAGSSTFVPACLYRQLPYDPLRDFEPVARVAIAPYGLLSSPALGVKSIADLVALAKRKPAELTYASSGIGSLGHLGMELFAHSAGIRLTHVPYKGVVLPEVVSGRIALTMSNIALAAPLVRSGKLVALGVSGDTRARSMPEVPTLSEGGVRVQFVAWWGVFAPAKTPPAVVNRLATDIEQLTKQKDFQEKLAAQGYEPGYLAPPAFAKFLREEHDRWCRVAKEARAIID